MLINAIKFTRAVTAAEIVKPVTTYLSVLKLTKVESKKGFIFIDSKYGTSDLSLQTWLTAEDFKRESEAEEISFLCDRTVADYLSTFSFRESDEIQLRQEEAGKITIRTGGFKDTIRTELSLTVQHVTEWLKDDEDSGTGAKISVALPKEEFLRDIKTLSGYADPKNPMLLQSTIHIIAEPGEINLAATTGHVLNLRQKASVPENLNENFYKTCIRSDSFRSAESVIQRLKDGAESLTITDDVNYIRVAGESFRIRLRKIIEPSNLKQLTNNLISVTGNETVIKADRMQLKRALQVTNNFAQTAAPFQNYLDLTLEVDSGILTLESGDTSKQKVKEKINCTSNVISFRMDAISSRRLLKVVDAVEADTITLNIPASKLLIWIREETGTGSNLYVVSAGKPKTKTKAA